MWLLWQSCVSKIKNHQLCNINDTVFVTNTFNFHIYLLVFSKKSLIIISNPFQIIDSQRNIGNILSKPNILPFHSCNFHFPTYLREVAIKTQMPFEYISEILWTRHSPRLSHRLPSIGNGMPIDRGIVNEVI